MIFKVYGSKGLYGLSATAYTLALVVFAAFAALLFPRDMISPKKIANNFWTFAKFKPSSSRSIVMSFSVRFHTFKMFCIIQIMLGSSSLRSPP